MERNGEAGSRRDEMEKSSEARGGEGLRARGRCRQEGDVARTSKHHHTRRTSFSAASTMAKPIRSLTEEHGSIDSSFRMMLHLPTSSRFSFKSGVHPMSSAIFWATFEFGQPLVALEDEEPMLAKGMTWEIDGRPKEREQPEHSVQTETETRSSANLGVCTEQWYGRARGGLVHETERDLRGRLKFLRPVLVVIAVL